MPLELDDFQRMSKPYRLLTRVWNSSLFFPSFRRIEGGFGAPSKRPTADDLTWIRSDEPLWRSADESIGVLQKAMAGLSTELSVYGEHQFIAAISIHDVVELLKNKYATVSTKANALYEQLSKEITQTISKTKEPDNELKDTSPVLENIQKRVEQVTQETRGVA